MNTPNKITTARIGLALVRIIFFSLSFIPTSSSFAPEIVLAGFHCGFSWIDLVCFVLFIVAASTDAIDGKRARKNGLVTDLGKFLDPFADKFLVDSAFILLSCRKDFADHYQVLPLLAVLLVARDLARDGLRRTAAGKGKILAANRYGKVKTAVEMGLIPVLLLNGFPFSLLNFTSGFESWKNNRFSYTYIITNILTLVCLFFSLFSFVIYVRQNKEVLTEKDGKKE